MAADLDQAEPDVAQHDRHQRGYVEEQHQPAVEVAVEARPPSHGDADGDADHHRQREADGDAGQRDADVIGQAAVGDAVDQNAGDDLRRGQLARVGRERGQLPQQQEHAEGKGPLPGAGDQTHRGQ